MKLQDCGLTDEMFSHFDPTTGIARTFNASAMNRYARKHGIEVLEMPLCGSIVEYIKRERGIEAPKLERLCEPYLSEPVVAIEFDRGTILTVDGHHRMVKRFSLGLTTVKAFFFPTGQWERFVLEGIPNEISKRLSR